MLQVDLSRQLSNCVSSFLQKLYAHLSLTHDCAIELILGLSGGLDSVVLLDLLVQIIDSMDAAHKPKYILSAVYIDHQLQADSTRWSDFTQQLCSQYKIPFSFYAVDIVKCNNQSLEARARKARYTKIAQLVNSSNKVLLTAHHLNDQAETFLLQLMRSAGPRGLSAMPQIKKFAAGYHARPLLDIPRADLTLYAQSHYLRWVEDATNTELKFDRNYLRHQIIPHLSERWPSIVATISNSAKKCAEQQELLDEYLADDYEAICILQENNITLDKKGLCNKEILNSKIIDLHKLVQFKPNKQRALLIHWLRDNNANLTERKIIDQIIKCCVQAQTDKNPHVIYNGYTIRRYKDRLYLLSSNLKDITQKNLVNKWDYQLGAVLELPEKGVKISSYRYCPASHAAYSNSAVVISQSTDTHIKFRLGGERCRPSDRGGSVSLKKLLQEKEVPVWHRDKIPLFYVNDEIAHVVGIKVCDGFQVNEKNSNQEAWIIECEYF